MSRCKVVTPGIPKSVSELYIRTAVRRIDPLREEHEVHMATAMSRVVIEMGFRGHGLHLLGERFYGRGMPLPRCLT
jgi:hypothetical protein